MVHDVVQVVLEQFEKNRQEREAADRTFTLLGENLTVKATVAPEVVPSLVLLEASMAVVPDDSPSRQYPTRPAVLRMAEP